MAQEGQDRSGAPRKRTTPKASGPQKKAPTSSRTARSVDRPRRRQPEPAPKPTLNRDRVVALRRNKKKEVDHAKEMTARMGVKPVDRSERPEDGERLHVRIARAGICSRRKAEQLIREARVTVNGEIVAEMGVKVAPGDDIRVDGQPVAIVEHYTVLLNKPSGVLTTLSDPQGRPTIVRYLPQIGVQLKPVGRLDMDTEGLLLCTNDGELAQRLAHPRHGVEKEYQAVVRGIPDEKALKSLRTGVFVEGRRTAPAKFEVIHSELKANTTGLRITIHEGRKRQIRLMCESVGHPVISLKRVRIGPLKLFGMRSGEAKLLPQKDLNALRQAVGLEPI